MDGKFVSPYKRGAENGLVMGLFLSLMFCCWSLTIYDNPATAPLGLVGFVLMLGVPVLLYFMLRRTYRMSGGTSQLSALWMEGIMTFICGSLIAMMAGYIFMRFVQPDYLGDLYNRMLTSMNEAAKVADDADKAQMRDLAANFRQMLDNGLMPSAIELMLNLMWFVTFSGCVLSIIIASIVRAKKI